MSQYEIGLCFRLLIVRISHLLVESAIRSVKTEYFRRLFLTLSKASQMGLVLEILVEQDFYLYDDRC